MLRLSLEVPDEAEYRAIHQSPEPNAGQPRELLSRLLELPPVKFRFLDLPAPVIVFAGPKREIGPRLPRRLTFSLGFEDSSDMAAALQALSRLDARREVTFGLDVPIGAMEHWNPGLDRPPAFATQARALSLIEAAALTRHPRQLLGEGVNVVMVDLGLNQAALRAIAPQVSFGGGWSVVQRGAVQRNATPLRAPWRGHGSMVASGLLAVAPRVTLFDFPLLPERLADSVTWTSWAGEALRRVKEDILGAEGVRGLAEEHPGPWVFCHAWGVYDRRPEQRYSGPVPRFTADAGHPLNELVLELAKAGFDQVFAAGNGGQFCPHPLCGPGDTGPGESIFGAACLDEVLTVGAVRGDGIWIGYSSQGPAQPGFGQVNKPDLCAPSHFFADADASLVQSGTSAACGMAAGAVAALRGRGSPMAGWSSAELFERLRETARQRPGAAPGHDRRTGHGVINLAAALEGF